jgi:hypothetical protein
MHLLKLAMARANEMIEQYFKGDIVTNIVWSIGDTAYIAVRHVKENRRPNKLM